MNSQEEQLEFDNQRKGEEIILLHRRHPWVLAKMAFVCVLILAAVFLAFLIFGASRVSAIALVFGLLIIITYALIRWFVYANDIYILTNERIISIEQNGFFSRRVSEAELENILNVSYEIRGPIKSLLNFGEVSVDTSGSDANNLILKNVENPHFLQEKIVQARKNYMQSANI